MQTKPRIERIERFCKQFEILTSKGTETPLISPAEVWR